MDLGQICLTFYSRLLSMTAKIKLTQFEIQCNIYSICLLFTIPHFLFTIFHYLFTIFSLSFHYFFTIFSLSFHYPSLSFPIFCYPSLSFYYLSLSFTIPHYLFTIFRYPSLSFHYLSLSSLYSNIRSIIFQISIVLNGL